MPDIFEAILFSDVDKTLQPKVRSECCCSQRTQKSVILLTFRTQAERSNSPVILFYDGVVVVVVDSVRVLNLDLIEGILPKSAIDLDGIFIAVFLDEIESSRPTIG